MTGQALGPTRARLRDGRWHFQHGPIDLLLDADGEAGACERSMSECWRRFQSVLPELVAELPQLRQPLTEPMAMRGTVAARMGRACLPFAASTFITPMAAVAGAVADELIAFFHCTGIRRAWINNGGDIALHLTRGQQYRVGIWSNIESLLMERADCNLDSIFVVGDEMPVRGIATSGWRGRSFSLGVADSVTVLADTAADADAAATVIANAVNCDCPGIVRTPAEQLRDDTDLGSLPVTVNVPALPRWAIEVALASGRAEAERWRALGQIHAAALFLQGVVEVISINPAPSLPPIAPRIALEGIGA
jgi:uncharacterized protein